MIKLNMFNNEHLGKYTILFEYLGAFLVAMASILIIFIISFNVGSVWYYPLFVFFNMVGLFGVCDTLLFNDQKARKKGVKLWEVFNGTTFFHLSVYLLLFAIGFSIIGK